MRALTPADQFVLTCVVIVLLFFLARAVFSRIVGGVTDGVDAYDDYLLAGKELRKRDVRESTAATYTAFATVFFWFVALGGSYGWFLFLIPVFLYVGNRVFTTSVEKYGVELGEFSTIGAYIRSKSTFKPLHYFVDFIIAVFLFSALLVEIVIGSGIVAAMMPDVWGGQLFFLVLISLLVISYVIVGGFRAVILSDTIQLYLTSAGVLALLVFSAAYLPNPSEAGRILFTPRVPPVGLIAFIVSVLAVQMFGPICQLQNWQRIAASQNPAQALKAHRQGGLVGAVLWVLMIVCALLLHVKLEAVVSFDSIFASMKQQGVLAAYGLYPLVFVGFIAAMISTADSAMAALYLLLYDGVRRRKKRKAEEFRPSFRHHIGMGIALFALILLVYVLNQTNISAFAVSVIYFLFNQLIVVFPALAFLGLERFLRDNNEAKVILDQEHGKVEKNLTLGMAVGWLAVFIMSVIGYYSGSLNCTMFASATGVAVAWAVSIQSWGVLRKAWLVSMVKPAVG